MKERLISALNSLPKERLIAALSTIPLIAAATMSGSCAASCPYGLVNDPYPGQCPRYTDFNGDGICDFSQATAAVASTNSATSSHTSTQTNSTDHNDSTITDPGTDSGTGHLPGDGTGYFVIPVSILLIASYLFTHYLFSKGILKQKKHRRLWNLLLTAGYLGTGVTGVMLTLMINIGLKTALNPSITFWHAELAILMTVTTLIHVHLYRKPFKNIFKTLYSFKTNPTEKIGK
jgi:hypothetical protein